MSAFNGWDAADHAEEAERLLDSSEREDWRDDADIPRCDPLVAAGVHALLAIHATLREISERLGRQS